MLTRFLYIFFTILFILNNTSYSQIFFRIKADFTIKTKISGGAGQLVIGQVYYDDASKQIVYRITYPNNEIWISKDTVLYKIVDGKIINKSGLPTIADFSIYHLALSGTLADYGLKKSVFTLKKTEKDKGLIINTWQAPEGSNKKYGTILVSNKEKQLHGIIFQNNRGEILLKQFFNNYNNFNGLLFPCEIIQITNLKGKEIYEVTSYKNILVNDMNEENIYNYKIPR